MDIIAKKGERSSSTEDNQERDQREGRKEGRKEEREREQIVAEVEVWKFFVSFYVLSLSVGQ